MYITKKNISPPHRPSRYGRVGGAPVPGVDGAGGDRMAKTAAAGDLTRLVCIEMVHGAAGSNALGAKRNLWVPAKEGNDFDLTPSSLSPLERSVTT